MKSSCSGGGQCKSVESAEVTALCTIMLLDDVIFSIVFLLPLVCITAAFPV